jgi:hypothetical protein
MQNLQVAAFSVCITFCSVCAIAQNIQNRSVSVNEPNYNKPKLFDDLPERINFDPTILSALLNTKVGQSIDLAVTPGFRISGQVVSKADDQNSTSVVVRLVNRPGARLIFTKLTDPNNSVKYIGRIISLKHGDSYEIISENNQYYLKKRGINELMTE